MPRTTTRHGPAAGAPGGAPPRLAKLHTPEYLRLDKGELSTVLDMLRDPLVSHVFLLLQAFSDFSTGEFLGTYARLMDLCTPPEPERGKRREGPSYKQLRRAVDDLVAVGMAARGETNETQGQLRLYLAPRASNGKSKLSSARSKGRV